MKNILFLFNFGSEIRQFVYSGILDELLKKNYKVFVSLRVKNEKVLECFDNRIEILPYFKKGTPFYLNMLKIILDEANKRSQSWNYMKTETKFKKPISKIVYFILFYILKILVKVKPLRFLLSELEIRIMNSLFSSQYSELLKNNEINQVVVNVPNYNYHFLATAKSMNIPVSLIFHTNKDLYTLGRLSPFYKNIAVWNETMKEELLSINENINENSVDVIGCSHFTGFTSRKNSSKSTKPIEILYIAAAPFVVTNEYGYILILEEKLHDLGINNYVINIKVNPMDSTSYWDDFSSKNIHIVRSKWIWNENEAFNYPEKLDLENFSLLLQKAKCCVGLPSTVVIEAALIKTPFVNICFNNEKVDSIYENISDMWNAPFYKNAQNYGAAVGTFSEHELKKELKRFIIDGENLETEQKIFIDNELTYTGIELRNKAIQFLENHYV